jgi:HlyD family secretion protein
MIEHWSSGAGLRWAKDKNEKGEMMGLRSYTSALCTALLCFAPNCFSDVSALGRIEPEDGIINITAPVVLEAGNGIVLGELYVRAGETVKEGTLLATTEAHDVLEALNHEATVSHELAIRDALAAEALSDADCVKAKVTRKEADRRKSLLKQNLSSIEEAERASADAEFQEASCRASKIVAAASSAKVLVAKSQMALRKTMLERSNVYAPFAGKVLSIAAWPGEAVGPNGIMEFAKTEQMFAIAEVYETDIKAVKPGQSAVVKTNVLEQPLTGTVEKIRPLIRKQDVMGTDPAARKDARIIEVEIKLDDSEAVANLTNLQVEILIVSE